MPPWKRPGFRRDYFRTGEVFCFRGSGVSVHDAAFKRMFSHPLMIELLLRRHVAEWSERIDYSTLEPLPPELVSESLQRRYPDMMWRARTGDESDLLILLGALRRATEACKDEDFDQFMGGCVRSMLVSRGFSAEQLEEAMTMGRVVTAFERGMEELVSRGRVEGQAQMLRQMAARKFGSETADELAHLFARRSDPEHFDQVAIAILECGSSEEFIARVREA